MSATTAVSRPRSARAVVWSRRRRASAKVVRAFAHSPSGMFGLGIVVLFAVLAVFAPLIFDASYLDVTKAPGRPFSPPSWEYWLGTDDSGRSMLALVVWGARPALLVGLCATMVSMFLGTVVGIAAGHFRGFRGGVLDRLTDWFLVIPYLPLAIVLVSVLGRSIIAIIIVIGVTSWTGTARLIRAQTLAVEGRPYLERSKVLGGGHLHQMSKHVLPNVMPLVLANTTLAISGAVLSETTLSFLGIGDSSAISWGSILNAAFGSGSISLGAWWFITAPGVCVVLIVLAFNLVGRALEDLLDPYQKGAKSR